MENTKKIKETCCEWCNRPQLPYHRLDCKDCKCHNLQEELCKGCKKFGKREGCYTCSPDKMVEGEINVKDLWCSHGDVSHSYEDAKTCPDCIRTQKEFEQAQKDGTLDKLLNPPQVEQEEWTKELIKAEKDGTLEPMSNTGIKCLTDFITKVLSTARKEALETRNKELVEAGEGLKKTGIHEFEIGFYKCKWCDEPRKGVYRVRNVIQRDEKSGGEVAEVSETEYDITGLPCLKNTSSTHNQAIESYQKLIQSK